MTDNQWFWIVLVFWIVVLVFIYMLNHGAHKDDADDDSY